MLTDSEMSSLDEQTATEKSRLCMGWKWRTTSCRLLAKRDDWLALCWGRWRWVCCLAPWYPRLLVSVASSDRFAFEDSPRNCSRSKEIWSVWEVAKRLSSRGCRPTTYCARLMWSALIPLTFSLMIAALSNVIGSAAKQPDRVLRYCRGEQLLYHFDPILATQVTLFRGGEPISQDPVLHVVSGYRWLKRTAGTGRRHQAHHSGIFLSRSRSDGDAGI